MKEISLSEAFAYCLTQTSYVVWLIIAVVVSAGLIYLALRSYQKNQNFTFFQLGCWIAAVVFFMFALLYRPTDVKANTTPEQASKGIYIG